MSSVNRTTLKTYFTKGSTPTQQQFADLIDSFLDTADDNLYNSASRLGIGDMQPAALLSLLRSADTTTTGTITILTGSTSATGTGFSKCVAGQFIRSGTQVFLLAAVADDTHATVTEAAVQDIKVAGFTVITPLLLARSSQSGQLLIVNDNGYTGIGTVNPQKALTVKGDIQAGNLICQSLAGDGKQITNLQAASISGQLTAAQLPATIDASRITGSFTAGQLPAINASDITGFDSFLCISPIVTGTGGVHLSWAIYDGDTVVLNYTINGTAMSSSSSSGAIHLIQPDFLVVVNEDTLFTLTATKTIKGVPVVCYQKQLWIQVVQTLAQNLGCAFAKGYDATYAITAAGNKFRLVLLNVANVQQLGTASKTAGYSRKATGMGIAGFYVMMGFGWDNSTYDPVLDTIFGVAPTTQPDHYWSMDESSGATVIDGPQGVNGTLSATASRVSPGCIGPGAVHIDGSNDSKVDFTHAIGQFGTADFTVALWVNTAETYRYFDLLGNRTDGSHGNFFSLRMTGLHESLPHGMVAAEIDQDGNGTNYIPLNSSVTGLNDGNWHHIGVVRSGTSLSLYIDGQLSAHGAAAGVANINNGNNFILGRSLDPSVEAKFAPTASFDELYVFNSALTAAQVNGLFGLKQ